MAPILGFVSALEISAVWKSYYPAIQLILCITVIFSCVIFIFIYVITMLPSFLSDVNDGKKTKEKIPSPSQV